MQAFFVLVSKGKFLVDVRCLLRALCAPTPDPTPDPTPRLRLLIKASAPKKGFGDTKAVKDVSARPGMGSALTGSAYFTSLTSRRASTSVTPALAGRD